MSMPIIPPFAIAASYQNSQYATGTYTQGGSQVFSHLVTPPSAGVSAETAADNRAHAQGILGVLCSFRGAGSHHDGCPHRGHVLLGVG